MKNIDQVKLSDLQENKHESFWYFTDLLISVLVALWYLFGDGFEMMSNYFGQSNWFVLLLKFVGFFVLIYSPSLIVEARNNFKKHKTEMVKGDLKWLIGGIVLGWLTSLVGLIVWLLIFVGFAKLLGSFWWICIPMITILMAVIFEPLKLRAMRGRKLPGKEFFDLFSWVKEKTGISINDIYRLKNPGPNVVIELKTRNLLISDQIFDSMTEAEIKSLVLHEVGHLKRKNFLLTLSYLNVGKSLIGYFLIAWIMKNYLGWVEWQNMGQMLVWYLLIIALSQIFSFVLGLPLIFWRRQEEYLADEFAVRQMGEVHSLSRALHNVTGQMLTHMFEHNEKISPLREYPSTAQRIKRLQRIFN